MLCFFHIFFIPGNGEKNGDVETGWRRGRSQEDSDDDEDNEEDDDDNNNDNDVDEDGRQHFFQG